MLAYYVEWRLREAWAPILFHDHDREAALHDRISPITAADISNPAKRKRGRRRNDEGLPVSSFTGLISHLATLTLNLVASSRAPNPIIVIAANQRHFKKRRSNCSEPLCYASSRPPQRLATQTSE